MKIKTMYVLAAIAFIIFVVYAIYGLQELRGSPSLAYSINYVILSVSLCIAGVLALSDPEKIKDIFIRWYAGRGFAGTLSLISGCYLIVYALFTPSDLELMVVLERMLATFIGFLHLVVVGRLLWKRPQLDE